ncbi:fasciclin domain-containing protein [Ulvibacterium marinum]|uniref:Fasciclin domain-containing protein n=1 Tax=Ulvibacterium marinum TaxID=2419782 RepID=A0A3B0CA69_9FLAO|nr:fasciclin domain-containing protein [Ulvibacterium marinum]RKN81474.1 fasciclin domain-containing protein [Ulvibacterium marinum]
MKYLVPSILLFFLLFPIISLAQGNITSTNSAALLSKMDPEKSIISNTENSKNHRTLSAVIKAADLEETLGYDGPFTVFAPSDKAFEEFSLRKALHLLDSENKEDLKALLTYHIIAGKFTTSQILRAMCRGNGRATFTTVQGKEVVVTMEGIDIVLTDDFGNSAKITTADANQCNGVIHEIDSVIVPHQM